MADNIEEEEICEGIWEDSIELLGEYGRRIVIDRDDEEMYPCYGRSKTIVLKATVKDGDQEKEVRIFSPAPLSRSRVVRVRVKGDDYYLTARSPAPRIGFSVNLPLPSSLDRLPNREGWRQKFATLEDAQRFRGIIDQVKQQMEGKSAESGEVGEERVKE